MVLVTPALAQCIFLIVAFAFARGAEAATPDWSKWADLRTVEVVSVDEGGRPRTTTVWIVVLDGQPYLRTGGTTWGGNVQRGGTLKLKGSPGEYELRVEKVTDPLLQEKVMAAFRAKYGFWDRLSGLIRFGGSRIFRLSR